jgi:glycine betaine/proline transport system ATP-binding protein
VENVNRSLALTAASVMIRPRYVVHPKDGPRTALNFMEKHGLSTLFVLDRFGKLRGYISAEDASELASRGIKDLADIIQDDMPTANPETPLADLLDVMAYTKVPIAVIDEEGRLQGTLVRGSVIAGLAGGRGESING